MKSNNYKEISMSDLKYIADSFSRIFRGESLDDSEITQLTSTVELAISENRINRQVVGDEALCRLFRGIVRTACHLQTANYHAAEVYALLTSRKDAEAVLVEQLQTQAETDKKCIATLRSEIDQLRGQLETAAQKHKHDFAELKNDVDDLCTKSDREIAELRKQLDDSMLLCKTLETEKAELASSLENARDEIESLSYSLVNDTETESLRSQLADAQAKLYVALADAEELRQLLYADPLIDTYEMDDRDIDIEDLLEDWQDTEPLNIDGDGDSYETDIIDDANESTTTDKKFVLILHGDYYWVIPETNCVVCRREILIKSSLDAPDTQRYGSTTDHMYTFKVDGVLVQVPVNTSAVVDFTLDKLDAVKETYGIDVSLEDLI